MPLAVPIRHACPTSSRLLFSASITPHSRLAPPLAQGPRPPLGRRVDRRAAARRGAQPLARTRTGGSNSRPSLHPYAGVSSDGSLDPGGAPTRSTPRRSTAQTGGSRATRQASPDSDAPAPPPTPGNPLASRPRPRRPTHRHLASARLDRARHCRGCRPRPFDCPPASCRRSGVVWLGQV